MHEMDITGKYYFIAEKENKQKGKFPIRIIKSYSNLKKLNEAVKSYISIGYILICGNFAYKNKGNDLNLFTEL